MKITIKKSTGPKIKPIVPMMLLESMRFDDYKMNNNFTLFLVSDCNYQKFQRLSVYRIIS